MNRRALWLAAALLLASLAACGEPRYRRQHAAFGQPLEIIIHGLDEARAARVSDAILADFARLDALLGAHPNSALSALNAAIARGERDIAIPPELAQALAEARRLARESGGSFEPAAGTLARLWGIGAEIAPANPPAPESIDALRAAAPRMSDVVIGDAAVRVANPAVQIDLQGFAVGYALDRARGVLRMNGAYDALVNIGGNLTVSGSAGRRPWKVGSQHPRRPGALAGLELFDGETLASVGDYQGPRTPAGESRAPVLDPRTGRPAQGLQAVSVITERGPSSSAMAVLAARAGLAAGAGDVRAPALTFGAVLALAVDRDGKAYVTAPLARRIEFSPPLPPIVELP